MKVDRRTENVIRDRMKWMKKWLALRNYDIGNMRTRYLFIYLCTLKVLYEKELACKMIHTMNKKYVKPLDDSMVESVIAKVYKRETYLFKNESIINKLGITEQEAEKLEIGHNLREKEERERRQFYNFVLCMEIIERYQAGESIKQIAESVTEFSKSKIEKLLKEHAKQRKHERNCWVWDLLQMGKSISEIHKITKLDRNTIRSIRDGENPYNLFNKEWNKDESGLAEFVDSSCHSFYSLYKTECSMTTADSYNEALHRIQTTKENILLIGAAGTAKTTLLNEFISSLSKGERDQTLIVAPTGTATENLNGLTIHRAFGLDIGVLVPEESVDVPNQLLKVSRIIIDEISMVRIDLFDRIYQIIKHIETQKAKKIQLIVCGDYSQIPPIVTKSDRSILKQYWPDAKEYFAFESQYWDTFNFKKILLTHIFRQSDEDFIHHLNDIKYGRLDALDWFNQKCFRKNYNRMAIHICAKNHDVDIINQRMLKHAWFEDTYRTFYAIEEELLESDTLPCPKELTLCENARVMIIANDKEYHNGNLGWVVDFDDDTIVIDLDNKKRVNVRRKKFQLESGATYEQFPIVLGYAITANKAQGCTFDSVIIHSGFFAPSQLYVALSRCRDINKLCLMDKLTPNDLVVSVLALSMTI